MISGLIVNAKLTCFLDFIDAFYGPECGDYGEFSVWGLGLRLQGLGFGIQDLGFRVRGAGLRV
jgi:hypothetical protein